MQVEPYNYSQDVGLKIYDRVHLKLIFKSS